MLSGRGLTHVFVAGSLIACVGCSPDGSESLAGPSLPAAPLGAQLPFGSYRLAFEAGDACAGRLAEASRVTFNVTLSPVTIGPTDHYVVDVPGNPIGFGLMVEEREVWVEIDLPLTGATSRGRVKVTAVGRGDAGAAASPGISIPIGYTFELDGVGACLGTDGRMTLSR